MTELIPRRRLLTGLGSVVAAAALLPACSRTSARGQPTGTDQILYVPSEWLPGNGASGSTRIPINQLAGQGPGTLSVRRNRIRITADAHKSSTRECFVLNSTADTKDSEICSTWYPHAVGRKVPQMGHVHRADGHRAIVIDQDIYARTTTWLAVWSWDGKRGLHALGRVPATVGTTDRPIVVGWERTRADPRFIALYVDQFGGIRIGDKIRVVGTGEKAVDGDWTVHGIVENASYKGTGTGPLLVLEDPDHAAVVPYTPLRGVVEYQVVNTESQYPCRVRSRVIGNLVQAKKWNARVAEPPWDPGVYRGGQAWELDLSKLENAQVPKTGRCGILANHLQPGGHVEYDDVTITRL